MWHYWYGWGIVVENRFDSLPVSVKLESVRNMVIDYTFDGKFHSEDIAPRLSFTEYRLEGFSQERPIDWSEHEGRWCMFWDKPRSSGFDACKAIYKLKSYDEEEMYPFNTTLDVRFRFCQPLSEAVIKELNLEN